MITTGEAPTSRGKGRGVLYITARQPERAFLVAADVRGGKGNSWRIEDSLAELEMLARTAGAIVVGSASQRLEHAQPSFYIGRGKVQEIADQQSILDYTVVIFDDELSPTQQRNLERELGVKIIDRTALILDIFAQHASTREGRLQVELAQHQYLLPRLRGQWSHLERLGGGIGTRGPGETQIETDRRLISRRIQKLKRELEEVRRQRSLYRRRRARQGLPVVSLVGYTNAGKSTLMRALSGADVLVEDKLFATLDPVTRRVKAPSGGIFLLTDTVGFIQKLPAHLVAAFRATLEELSEADVLLHVVDITHGSAAEQSATVEATLQELGLAEKPVITVLNKMDAFQREGGLPVEGLEELGDTAVPLASEAGCFVLASAAKGWGVREVLRAIDSTLASLGRQS